MVSSRCLLSMLVGFPFLAFGTFHNKLVLMKNLDASILYVLQHSVFFALHYLFLSLLWEVHLSKICSKSALVIPFTTPRCNIRSTQKFVTFTLYLWITLTKNFMKKKKKRSGKHVKRSLFDGVDNFHLVQRQIKVPKPIYKLR